LYELEQKLARQGVIRQPDEPLSRWLLRAVAEPGLVDMKEPLHELLQLHYRYRFDPLGLNQDEREVLRQEARICLAGLDRKPDARSSSKRITRA